MSVVEKVGGQERKSRVKEREEGRDRGSERENERARERKTESERERERESWGFLFLLLWPSIRLINKQTNKKKN